MRIVPDRFCGKFLSSEKSRLEVTRSIWSNFGLPEAGLWSRSPYWVADRHAPPSATCSIFFYVSQKHHKMRFWNVKNKCTKQFWERTPSNGGRVSRMGFRHFRQTRLRSSNRLQYWDLSWDLVQNQWETWFWERKVVWEHFLQSETLRKTSWRHVRACGRRKPR